jgi:hypothetical protein
MAISAVKISEKNKSKETGVKMQGLWLGFNWIKP